MRNSGKNQHHALITYTTASNRERGKKRNLRWKERNAEEENALRADEERNGELAKKVIKLLTSAECSSVFSRPHDGQVHYSCTRKWRSEQSELVCASPLGSQRIFFGLKIAFLGLHRKERINFWRLSKFKQSADRKKEISLTLEWFLKDLKKCFFSDVRRCEDSES